MNCPSGLRADLPRLGHCFERNSPTPLGPLRYGVGPDLVDLMRTHFGTSKRSICFIMGRGFDPRMNLGLSTLLKTQPDHAYKVALVRFGRAPARRRTATPRSWMKTLEI